MHVSGREECGTMSESNFMHGWAMLIGSLATIALILMAFGLMMGIVKPADPLKHVGTVLGIVIALILLLGALMSAWSSMSLWQQMALVAIGVCVWQWWRPRRQTRKRKEE